MQHLEHAWVIKMTGLVNGDVHDFASPSDDGMDEHMKGGIHQDNQHEVEEDALEETLGTEIEEHHEQGNDDGHEGENEMENSHGLEHVEGDESDEPEVEVKIMGE